MGNETSTPSEAEDDLRENIHTRSPYHQFSGKHLIDSDDDEVNEYDHLNVSFRKRGAFGSLRGSVIAAAATDGSNFVDPVLSAAAAGAAARKAKHRKRTHSNPFRQHLNDSSNNEWKKSLQRLAKTAASTASNAAHVTAPMLADAGSIVVESAKEFATDVQDEFSKPKYADANDGAESAVVFPNSPGRSWSGKSWYAPYSPFSAYDTDLSPTTPNTGQSDNMGRVRIDLQVTNHVPMAPSLKQKPNSERNEEHVSTQEREGEPKNKSRRSVQIVHFPELDKLHKTEVSQRAENRALPETIPKTEDNAAVESSKVSSSIDQQNGGVSISDSPGESDESCMQTTIDDSPEIENDDITTSSKSEKLLDKESDGLKEIEFTLLPETVEDALAGDSATETSDVEVQTKPEESNEIEFASTSVSVGDERAEHNEQSSSSGTKSEEVQPASLSVGAKVDSAGEETTDEKNSLDHTSANNDVQEHQELNESDCSEVPSTSDIKDLDIFDEFQQLVESAAKEGVFFSLDNEDSLAVLDFEVGNAEIERELEETEVSSPLEKELEDALKPLERVLEEASKPLEENLGKRTKSPVLTSTKTNEKDEEAVFEISVDEHGDDNDFPHIVLEVSTDSDVPISDTKSPSGKDTLDGFSWMTKYAAEQELRDLLERVENGEVVDEDRLYELELFERYQSGEKLSSDEMEDLESLLKWRQNLNNGDFITTDEKTNRDETSTMPPSFNANQSNDHKIADQDSECNDDIIMSNQGDECDHNNFFAERQVQSTCDENNDACESTRTNETEKLTMATQSEMENAWLYWSVGQKGSESSQLSTERLASILSISDPGTIPNGGKKDREVSYSNGNVSHTNEGWRYWAHVDGNVGNHHQIDLEEASLAPQESIASSSEKSQTSAKIPTSGNSPEWVYWSVRAWPQVGLAERTVHTSITKSEMESRSDLTLPGMVTANANGAVISNPESGWLYWARLGTIEQHTQVFSDSQRIQPDRTEETVMVGENPDKDSALAGERGEEETPLEQSISSPGNQPQRHGEQAKDDMAIVEQGQEETRLGESLFSPTGEVPNNPGQPSVDSVPPVRLPLLANRGETGWMFWSMMDEGSSQNKGEENKSSWDLHNTTAAQEVQLETDRAGVPVEQSGKPGWLQWALLDDARSPTSMTSLREPIQRSALQQVESSPTPISVQANHDSGWMFWSALREDSVQKEVIDELDFERTNCTNEVQLDTNQTNVKFKDNDEPGWLYWAQIEQPKARDPKQPEDDSMILESKGQSAESRPSGSALLASSSHGWLYWSTLGKVQTDSGSKTISLTSDLLEPSDLPEVQLRIPQTDVIGQQAGKPGWLHWAQFNELKAAHPKLSQNRDSISMSEEKSIDEDKNGKDPETDTSGWLYWSTMGAEIVRNHDGITKSFDFQHSTAPEEVSLRADITEESIEDAGRPDWLYWAQIDQSSVTAPTLLGLDFSLETEDQTHEDQTSSQTTQRTESNLSSLVESEETSGVKVITRGMKTRSHATEEFNFEEPIIVANSRVARELHTSYNPVILGTEDHKEEENIATVKGDESENDTVSNATIGLSRSSNVDVLTAVSKATGGSEVKRELHQQKDDGKSNNPQMGIVEVESDSSVGDRSSQIKPNANVENENDMKDNINMPSSLKKVVGIFAKLSVESRQAMKSWNGINQGNEQESQSGQQTVESREEMDILQDAQRLAKVASDLADEVLQARPFGLFSKANEQGESTRSEEKSSERPTAVEVGTIFPTVPSSTDFAVDLFNNSKEALGVAVSKLTVELSINEKQKQRSISIPDSVFRYDKSTISPTSLSTVVSVPLEDYERDLDEESVENDVAASWDLMPNSREVNMEHNLLQPTTNDSVAISSSLEGEVAQRVQQPIAGTKTKELDNPSNYGSTDNAVLSPMLSPKARRAKRASRTLMKLQSNEFDDSISRLEVELESADSSVAGGPSSPNEVKGFDQMNDPESLGLALVSFSSIDSIDFLKKIPQQQIEGPSSSLFWRILIANWKHSQIWKSMVSQSLSLDDDWLKREGILEEDRISINSSATIRFQVRNKEVLFFSSGCNQLISPYFQSQESGTRGLLEYLCDIGPTHLAPGDSNVESVLRNAAGQTEAAVLDVNGLLKLAESHQQSFAKLMRDVVNFAALENNSSEIKHSLGLKHYTAIHVKADRKYDGDILQVKDVLRGQIIFPNETSLICGLLCLHRKCKNVEKKETPQFKIVRLKNYFHKRDGRVSSLTEMPTGYRHILINVQIAGTLVAELQFQLAQLFDILGQDGYRLHAEISSSLGDSGNSNGRSKEESSVSGCRVTNACEIAKKILLVDHIKDSEQATTEEQQIKSQHAQKKGDVATSATTARKFNEGNPPSEVERKEVKGIAGIGAAEAPEGSQVSAGEVNISAIAAAAAKARSKEEKKPVGGIGAAAAAAGRSSMMKNFKASSKGGSIGGISDAVAKDRNGGDLTSAKKQVEREPIGGIGAAAAAAARRSKMKSFKASSKGGGIAAIAAAAAEERNGGNPILTKSQAQKEPVAGIGAAAAAAARRSMMKSFLKTGSKGGSISAIADAIAEERNGGEPPIATKNQEEREPVGGIGVAAAASAQRSTMKNFKASSKGGGIAAIAAAVAEERNGGSSTVRTAQAGQGPIGGIGAAAAAAAAARNGKQKKLKPNVGEGSIASIAAAAAKTRDLKDHSNQNGKLVEKKSSKANPSASLENDKRSQTRQNDPLKTTTLNSRTREVDLIAEAINVGIEEASSNPRNLPALYCLYLLLRRLEEIDQDYFSKQGAGSSTPRPPMEKIKTMLLTRCLAICNQASSLGMFGWLEYGSSNVVERSLDLPIEMMQRLAFNFASSGDWNKASDILSSCVMRCEEYLSLHHPTTLCTMIDLATTFTQSSRQSEANALIKTVSDTVGEFLAECETVFFEDLRKRFAFESDQEQVFMLERKRSALSVLHTFTTDFNSLLSRDFLGLVDSIHQITLLNHSLVANCFAVLASCNAVCEGGSSARYEGSGRSLRFWSFAYLHYQHSLRGWTKIRTLSHPYAASAAFSVARCLRELGKIDESISFLESLVECLQDSSSHDDFGDGDLNMEPQLPESFSFLPPKSGHANESIGVSTSECRREQTVVLCLWTLAVYVVQRKPDEQGRVHALKLLHQASDILRNLLFHADDMHENTQKVCLELYTCVEEEARVLFEPLRMIQMQPPEIMDKLRMGYQSSLTSMRRKRWFQQHQQPSESASQLTHPVQKFI